MTTCQDACRCSSPVSLDLPAIEPEAPATGDLTVSLFAIPGMDCPAEEQLIRLVLQAIPGLARLEFDLARRELRVIHAGTPARLAQLLGQLGLGARLVSSGPEAAVAALGLGAPAPSPAQEVRVLKWLLAINALMFAVEIATGWLAQSTGLIADAMDMFADATVYGLALYAVGRDIRHQRRAATLSGWLQLLLALAALAEVLRRLVFGSAPEPPLMMSIALLALLANLACLVLLARHRHGGVHMKASWIFSTNDVLANLGVIAAGLLVAWTGSRYPDLLIGTLIALLVLNGARRILGLTRRGV
ncbi:MAG: cation transporter [Chromatiaceae bacterium]